MALITNSNSTTAIWEPPAAEDFTVDVEGEAQLLTRASSAVPRFVPLHEGLMIRGHARITHDQAGRQYKWAGSPVSVRADQ